MAQSASLCVCLRVCACVSHYSFINKHFVCSPLLPWLWVSMAGNAWRHIIGGGLGGKGDPKGATVFNAYG